MWWLKRENNDSGRLKQELMNHLDVLRMPVWNQGPQLCYSEEKKKKKGKDEGLLAKGTQNIEAGGQQEINLPFRI